MLLKDVLKQKIDSIEDLRMITHRIGLSPCNLEIWKKEIIEQEQAQLVERLVSENAKYQEELKANEYIELRKKEYPQWEKVMEALIENMEGKPEKLTEIKNWRKMVKGKYPKPRSL